MFEINSLRSWLIHNIIIFLQKFVIILVTKSSTNVSDKKISLFIIVSFIYSANKESEISAGNDRIVYAREVLKVEDYVLRHDSVCRHHFVPFCTSKWRNFIKFSAAKFSLVGNIRPATVVNLFKTEVGGSGVHFPEKIYTASLSTLVT